MLVVLGAMSGSDCRHFLSSPHPPPPAPISHLLVVFVPFLCFFFGKENETAATQAITGITHTLTSKIVFCMT